MDHDDYKVEEESPGKVYQRVKKCFIYSLIKKLEVDHLKKCNNAILSI